MTKGLWHQGPEVSERRLKLLMEVARKDQGLGKLASELLHVDKNCRMSAFSVKAELRYRAKPDAEAKEEADRKTAAADAAVSPLFLSRSM